MRRRLGLGLVHEHDPALPAPRGHEPALPRGPERPRPPRRADLVASPLDIRRELGSVKADTIILEAQFDIADPTMPELAQRTVDAAQRLYGTAAAKKVRDAFAARGIL